MKNVTILKSDLIVNLTENRDAHSATFAEAIAGYKAAAIKAARRLAEKIEEDVNTSLFIKLAKPEDHTDEYDRVLRMLIFETSDEVVLSAGDFSRYMEDDWDWKEQFTSLATGYSRS